MDLKPLQDFERCILEFTYYHFFHGDIIVVIGFVRYAFSIPTVTKQKKKKYSSFLID